MIFCREELGWLECTGESVFRLLTMKQIRSNALSKNHSLIKMDVRRSLAEPVNLIYLK
jgi:hypothetical protein